MAKRADRDAYRIEALRALLAGDDTLLSACKKLGYSMWAGHRLARAGGLTARKAVLTLAKSRAGLAARARDKMRDAAPRFEGVLVDRACLTCGVVFGSEGPHHRMCDGCRRWARGAGEDYSYHAPKRRSGAG